MSSRILKCRYIVLKEMKLDPLMSIDSLSPYERYQFLKEMSSMDKKDDEEIDFLFSIIVDDMFFKQSTSMNLKNDGLSVKDGKHAPPPWFHIPIYENNVKKASFHDQLEEQLKKEHEEKIMDEESS
jgi:hypothetical protein